MLVCSFDFRTASWITCYYSQQTGVVKYVYGHPTKMLCNKEDVHFKILKETEDQQPTRIEMSLNAGPKQLW